jgi:prepilin peptidase dependent protein B
MLMRKHPVKQPTVFAVNAFIGARRTLRRQSGLGLVELLIASAIGLFLLAGLTDFLGRSLTSSGRNFQDARLTQDLNVAMDLITRDLRRAGYSGTAQGYVTAAGAAGNPFTQNTPAADNGTNDGGINLATVGCVLYSYDRLPAPPVASDGALTNPERMGFKLLNGAVYAGTEATTCTMGVWQAVTDPALSLITVLSFEYLDGNGTAPAQPFAGGSGSNWVVCTRLIRVTLTGQLRNTPAVTRTLIQSVRVRNDWYRTGTTTCT